MQHWVTVFLQTANDNTKITAYDVLQQNVIYTKLDMMQALDITIDYVDVMVEIN
jgi:hypothetical protein